MRSSWITRFLPLFVMAGLVPAIHVFPSRETRRGCPPTGAGMTWSLHQPALLHRRLDKRGEQRVRRERPRFQLGVELHADKPGMVGVFDNFREQSVGRHAGKAHAVL